MDYHDIAYDLINRGILVNLRISRWRGSAKLKSDELGFKIKNFKVESLLPDEIIKDLNSIEMKARENLSQNSYDTTWGKFVPIIAFNNWHSNDVEIKKEYMNAAKNTCLKHDAILNSVQEKYSKLAIKIWHELHPDQGEPSQSFIQGVILKIVDKMPSGEDILASFKYETVFSRLQILSKVEESLDSESCKKINAICEENRIRWIDDFMVSTVFSLRGTIGEEALKILNVLEEDKPVKIKSIKKIKLMIQHFFSLNIYNDEEMSCLMNLLFNEVRKDSECRSSKSICEILNKIQKLSLIKLDIMKNKGI